MFMNAGHSVLYPLARSILVIIGCAKAGTELNMQLLFLWPHQTFAQCFLTGRRCEAACVKNSFKSTNLFFYRGVTCYPAALGQSLTTLKCSFVKHYRILIQFLLAMFLFAIDKRYKYWAFLDKRVQRFTRSYAVTSSAA